MSILVNAIMGGKMPFTYEELAIYEKKGLIYFSGNQWVPDWSWSREALEKLPNSELLAIYDELNEPS